VAPTATTTVTASIAKAATTKKSVNKKKVTISNMQFTVRRRIKVNKSG